MATTSFGSLAASGAVPDLLWWGFDSVYYHVAVDDRLAFIKLIERVAALEKGEKIVFSAPISMTRFPGDAEHTLLRSTKGMQGYTAVLETGDFWRVGFPSVNASHMGLYVQLPPAYCAGHSPQDIHDAILYFVSSVLGLRVAKASVSRFDVTFDFAIPEFKMLPLPNLNGDDPNCEIVTRAQYRRAYCRPGYTGWEVGKTNIVARMYDKFAEAKNDNDLEYWSDRYAETMAAGASVVRVEYVVRGAALRSFCLNNDIDTDEDGIPIKTKAAPPGAYVQLETLIDVENNLSQILAYLLKWCRFCVPSSRESSDRELSAWWALFDSAMRDAVAGGLDLRAFKRSTRPRTLETENIAKQMLGCARAIAARAALGDNPDRPALPGPRDLAIEAARIMLDLARRDPDRHAKRFQSTLDQVSITARLASEFSKPSDGYVSIPGTLGARLVAEAPKPSDGYVPISGY